MTEKHLTVTFAINTDTHEGAIAAFADWVDVAMVERFARASGITACVIHVSPSEGRFIQLGEPLTPKPLPHTDE